MKVIKSVYDYEKTQACSECNWSLRPNLARVHVCPDCGSRTMYVIGRWNRTMWLRFCDTIFTPFREEWNFERRKT